MAVVAVDSAGFREDGSTSSCGGITKWIEEKDGGEPGTHFDTGQKWRSSPSQRDDEVEEAAVMSDDALPEKRKDTLLLALRLLREETEVSTRKRMPR